MSLNLSHLSSKILSFVCKKSWKLGAPSFSCPSTPCNSRIYILHYWWRNKLVYFWDDKKQPWTKKDYLMVNWRAIFSRKTGLEIKWWSDWILTHMFEKHIAFKLPDMYFSCWEAVKCIQQSGQFILYRTFVMIQIF